MLPDQTLLAYLAGAIDSDGYITVQKTVRKVGARYAHAPAYYVPKIGFTSTESIVPELLRETFGGSVYTHRPKNTAHKLVYLWSITTAAAGTVANLLIPHLRLKRYQAEMIVYLCRVIQQQHDGPARLTAGKIAEREFIWSAVTRANQPRNRRIHHVAGMGAKK